MTILTILKVNVSEFDTLELRKKDLPERLNIKKEGKKIAKKKLEKSSGLRTESDPMTSVIISVATEVWNQTKWELVTLWVRIIYVPVED